MIGDAILAVLLLFCVKKLYSVESRLSKMENELDHIKNKMEVFKWPREKNQLL